MSIIFTKCNFFNTLRFFVKILTTVFILMSYLLLSGCGNNKSDNYSKADNKNSTVTTAVDNNTITGDTAKTGTEYLESIDIYADNNFDVPDGYLGQIEGRQYGETTQIEYYSTVAHKYKQAEIILPYGYNTSQTYPVLYLLHGMSGDYRNWSVMGAEYIVQNAHYDYNTPDMIIVCPTVFTSQEYDSEDGLSFNVLTAQYDKFIDELGGREASYIGFKYPTQFGYIGAFSATNGIFKDEPWADAVLKDYDYSKLKDNYKLLLYQVGTEDPFIDGVREFKQLFDEQHIKYMYYEMPGGHEGAVWQHGLYNFARRLFY
jgi:enterochelin esterase-like enzyme